MSTQIFKAQNGEQHQRCNFHLKRLWWQIHAFGTDNIFVCTATYNNTAQMAGWLNSMLTCVCKRIFVRLYILIIVCSSENVKEKTRCNRIKNSTLVFPSQLLSKKQFNLSHYNFWSSHCSWSVKSHVDTCRVGMARGLGKCVWMNIDISLAPSGVSSVGMKACKTLTKEHLPQDTDCFFSNLSHMNAVQYSLLDRDQRKSMLFFTTFKTARTQSNWDRV